MQQFGFMPGKNTKNVIVADREVQGIVPFGSRESVRSCRAEIVKTS